jgi:hypothetical protein
LTYSTAVFANERGKRKEALASMFNNGKIDPKLEYRSSQIKSKDERRTKDRSIAGTETLQSSKRNWKSQLTTRSRSLPAEAQK